MSKDSMYMQKFICTNKKCKDRHISQWVWLTEISNGMTYTHELCGSVLKPVFEQINQAPAIITGKHKLGRSPKEKAARQHKDFVKNILPTLDKQDQRHFVNKYKKQGKNWK